MDKKITYRISYAQFNAYFVYSTSLVRHNCLIIFTFRSNLRYISSHVKASYFWLDKFTHFPFDVAHIIKKWYDTLPEDSPKNSSFYAKEGTCCHNDASHATDEKWNSECWTTLLILITFFFIIIMIRH